MMNEAATNMTLNNEQIQRWKSPIPYLFGGLALMLTLVVVALLILACSYIKSSSSSNGNNNTSQGSEKLSDDDVEGENEPKIVVIMAGDDNPTYLAKPLPLPIVSLTNGHASH